MNSYRQLARPALESLESRLAPAIQLSIDKGHLYLTEVDVVAPVLVQVFESQPDGRLKIEITGDKFHWKSTMDGVDYNLPNDPPLSNSAIVSFSNNSKVILDVLLPNVDVQFGEIRNVSGGLAGLVVQDAKTITITGKIDMTASAGGVDFSSNHSITLVPDSGIQSTDGAITLSANLAATAATPGNGITLIKATVQTFGKGSITLAGAALAGGGVGRSGVVLANGSEVQTFDTGEITITGTAGEGIDDNRGVLISDLGTNVSTASGNLTVTGIGQGSGKNNNGIDILNGAQVQAGAEGTLKLYGTWYSGTSDNYGVRVEDTTNTNLTTLVTANGGDVVIVSDSVDPGSGNTGIFVGASGQVSTGEIGHVSLEDVGGQGIIVRGTVQTSAGRISILAVAGPNPRVGIFTGIAIQGGIVQSLDGGSILLNGAGGIGPGKGRCGVAITGGALIQTTNGSQASIDGITIFGKGGSSDGLDHGVLIVASTLFSPNKPIVISGTGGLGPNGFNHGVSIEKTVPDLSEVRGSRVTINGTAGIGLNSVAMNFSGLTLDALYTVQLVGDSMTTAVGSTIHGGASVSVSPRSNKVRVILGDNVPGLGLSLMSGFLAAISNTPQLNVGSTTTGDIVVGNNINTKPGYSTLYLTSSTTVKQQFANTAIVVPNLAIQTDLAIGTQNVPLRTQVLTLAAKSKTAGVFVLNLGGKMTLGKVDTVLATGAASSLEGVSAFKGNIDIKNVGALNVNSTVMTTGKPSIYGSITLTAIDQASTGQDLTLGTKAKILTDTGDINLRAGDNLTIEPTAILTAGGDKVIRLNVDFGNADPLVAGIASVLSNSITAQFLTLTGAVGGIDRFTVVPSKATRMIIDGVDGLPLARNILTLRLPANCMLTSIKPIGQGTLTFTQTWKKIQFTNISNVV